MNLLNYYTLEQCKIIFNAIEQPNFRIFKSIDIDKICRQNKRQITTPQKLFKFIHRCKNPQKLYVSISTFLSPQSNHGFFANQKVITKEGKYFYPRKGYLIADSILLDSQFFIDIDSNDLKVVQNDTRKIIKYMDDKKDYELRELNFSGTKGVHLLYEDLKRRKIKDPIKRIKYLKNRKGCLAKELIKLGLKTMDNHHINIMQNCFAVRSMLYSIKPNRNAIIPLNLKDFMQKDIYDILQFSKDPQGSKSFTRALRCRKAIEEQSNDKKVAFAKDNTLASQLYRDGQRDSRIFHPIYFKFIDSMVNGLKSNYITVLKLYKDKLNINKLKELQKLYKLSDFYIVKIGNFIYCYNTKSLQFERIVKILRKAKSRNLSYFITRRHLPIQITPSFYENGETANEIEYIGTLKSQYGLHDNHSKPHSKLFGLDYENLVGKENNIGLMRVS